MVAVKRISGVAQTVKSVKKKITKLRRQELPFDPKPGSPIDLSPEKFRHSDEFSKMMDRAHRYAMRTNWSYGS